MPYTVPKYPLVPLLSYQLLIPKSYCYLFHSTQKKNQTLVDYCWNLFKAEKHRVHAVVEKTFPSLDLRKHLVAFHALTGCDTTSFLYGISKKSALKVYRDKYEPFEGLGEGDLTDQMIKD